MSDRHGPSKDWFERAEVMAICRIHVRCTLHMYVESLRIRTCILPENHRALLVGSQSKSKGVYNCAVVEY